MNITMKINFTVVKFKCTTKESAILKFYYMKMLAYTMLRLQ